MTDAFLEEDFVSMIADYRNEIKENMRQLDVLRLVSQNFSSADWVRYSHTDDGIFSKAYETWSRTYGYIFVIPLSKFHGLECYPYGEVTIRKVFPISTATDMENHEKYIYYSPYRQEGIVCMSKRSDKDLTEKDTSGLTYFGHVFACNDQILFPAP